MYFESSTITTTTTTATAAVAATSCLNFIFFIAVTHWNIARQWLLVGVLVGLLFLFALNIVAIIELLLLLLLLLLATTSAAAATAFLNYYCCRLSVENMSGVKIGSTHTHSYSCTYINKTIQYINHNITTMIQ